uniref:Uncharacterized protein n=1 Tax=Romanomermis culicivorax TaxID=13658 RepID=A0A915L348_ROMCU
GQLQLLLRHVTREQFIECCGLVVSQIAVSGSGCYLAIDVGFGILWRVFCHHDELVWLEFDAIWRIIDEE